MNRIIQKFQQLKKGKQKAFIAFITAGDPSLNTTEELVLSFEKCGVDLVELGVPFSDPLADGPIIQAASQRALQKGVTLDKILSIVERIRKRSQIPLALMTYYNPIFHYGEEQFIKDAKKVGVDGLIVPDLPPEEAKNLIRFAKKNRLSTIFFLSPTTTAQRRKMIVHASTGFIYYVSITGVTGTQKMLPSSVIANVRLAKRLTKTPICVGFGVSTTQQVKDIGRVADGVIVGSSIVQEIERQRSRRNLVQNVSHYVARLVKSLK